MARIVGLEYASDYSPELAPAPYINIARGNNFTGRVLVSELPTHSDGFITAGFYLRVGDSRQYAYGVGWVRGEESSVYIEAYSFNAYTVFDPGDLPQFRSINIQLWAAWGWLSGVVPDWKATEIVSGGAADVYRNISEAPIPVLIDVSRPESSYW